MVVNIQRGHRLELVVIGGGYVGLVSAACFAEMGFHVSCLDIDSKKVEALNRGLIPIYEPGLEELVKKNCAAKRLYFTTNYESAIPTATACFIAVDTPQAADGSCNLQSVIRAAHSIGQNMSNYLVIVTKSTVPVGTHKVIRDVIEGELAARDLALSFDVVSNPEFLKEGCAVQDFMKPDRVIVGVESERAEEVMRSIYHPFMLSSDRLLVMDPASAELSKYAANTMLALRISYMNWLSGICEQTGADILAVRQGIGSDKRIGNQFLWAGVGFGGSCFPKDILALRHISSEVNQAAHLIDAIVSINRRQKLLLGEEILAYFANMGGARNKTVAILGLAFKPDTDDIRDAPSLVLIDQLLQAGCSLQLFDPVAIPNVKKIIGNTPQVTFCPDEITCITDADAIALVTEWKQFRSIDWRKAADFVRGKALFDGRNQYDPEDMKQLGYFYYGIGRRNSSKFTEPQQTPKCNNSQIAQRQPLI